jgi:long-chain acyl-CoA synthetase
MGFDYFARKNPHAIALIDPRGREWSRGQLASLVNRFARALRAQGLRPGDVIAVLAPNNAEFIASYLAATQIGLYFVPVNWHLAAPEIQYILDDSGASAVLVHERFAQHVPRRDAEQRTLISIGPAPGFTALDEFVSGHSDAPLEDAVPGRPMFYTSATTGWPKAIVLPLPESGATLEKIIRFHISGGIALEQGHVHLCASMLYHGAPLDISIISVHMGHLLVLVDRWDPEGLLKLIDRHAVTTTVMVPTMFIRMLKLPPETRARYRVDTLKRVVHTGAPCPVETKREMIDWWGPVLWDAYGAAEGAGTSVGSEEWCRYPGTVGRAIPGTELRILDDNGDEVPAGVPGTIYFTRFTGDRFEYKGDPQKTAACHRGKLFTVGDIGYVNEAGYLFICDRHTDMIISAGMNIYSAEVERVLVLHPAVADCAVIGMPDTMLGEAVKAVVQPVAGHSVTRQLTVELLDFLRPQLSAAKLPKRIDYVKELPRAPSGKLYKRRLRELQPDQLIPVG